MAFNFGGFNNDVSESDADNDDVPAGFGGFGQSQQQNDGDGAFSFGQAFNKDDGSDDSYDSPEVSKKPTDVDMHISSHHTELSESSEQIIVPPIEEVQQAPPPPPQQNKPPTQQPVPRKVPKAPPKMAPLERRPITASTELQLKKLNSLHATSRPLKILKTVASPQLPRGINRRVEPDTPKLLSAEKIETPKFNDEPDPVLPAPSIAIEDLDLDEIDLKITDLMIPAEERFTVLMDKIQRLREVYWNVSERIDAVAVKSSLLHAKLVLTITDPSLNNKMETIRSMLNK